MTGARNCTSRVLGALNDCAAAGSSMPPAPALAQKLDLSTISVRRALRALISAGLIERLQQGRGAGTDTFRLVDSGKVLHGALWPRQGRAAKPAALATVEAKEQMAVRKCLRCRDTFLSAHKGNRICEPCKSSEAFHGAVESYSTTPLKPGRVHRPLRHGLMVDLA